MRLLGGGDGSGNFGHQGRPGEVGGSSNLEDRRFQLARVSHEIGPGEYWKRADAYAEILTDEERLALISWNDTEECKQIQTYLRTGDSFEPYLKKVIPLIDSGLQKGILEDNLVVFRATAQLPTWMSAGAEFSDAGYISTSTSTDASNFFLQTTVVKGGRQHSGVLMRIFLRKGTHVGYVSDGDHLRETEVMLPRNTKIRILSDPKKLTPITAKDIFNYDADENDRIYYVDAEVIE